MPEDRSPHERLRELSDTLHDVREELIVLQRYADECGLETVGDGLNEAVRLASLCYSMTKATTAEALRIYNAKRASTGT